jgi:KUP system potassium uptake protein
VAAFVGAIAAATVAIHRRPRPGTAVFLNANPDTTPLALRAEVEHNHVLHECVLILSLSTERIPYVHDADRL